ncbi:MAG: PAS domain-containing protein [Campylobacterota bacterium]|nr:PAS domain-containing protein [Campylobacterota bacterium]
MKNSESITQLQTRIKALESQNKRIKKEYDESLSLFDKGEVSLFKWNNNDTWSTEYASKNVLELTGYSAEEFLSSEITFADIVYRDDLTTVICEVEYALKYNTEYFTHMPYRILTKEKKLKWVLDNTYMIRDSYGEVTHFLGTISDITQLKQYETELENMVERKSEEIILQKDILYRQHRLTTIGETMEMIAHQWRQPLNHVGANLSKLEMLNRKKLHNGEIQKIVEDSNFSLEYISQTVDDFSNYFSPTKDKKNFSLNALIENFKKITDTLMKSIDIKYTMPQEKTLLYGHENELLQVLLVLLNNAKDAIELKNKKSAFHGEVTLSVVNADDLTTILVQDNAGGIKTEIIDKIFEPYFTTKFKSQGTGLGLYMTKMIIEKDMNGTIEVENRNDGALFKITLGHK